MSLIMSMFSLFHGDDHVGILVVLDVSVSLFELQTYVQALCEVLGL